MNKAKFSDFWYKKHNKVFAILFSSLAIIFLAVHYLSLEVMTGWSYFQKDPGEIWNLFVYAVVFLIILIGNIRNDSVAYTGILMFVCYMGLDAGSTVIKYGKDALSIFQGSRFDVSLIPFFLECASIVGLVLLGIFLYVRSYQYMKGTYSNFIVLRVLAICFACCVALSQGLIYILIILFSGTGVFVLPTALSVSTLFVAVAVIFTIERLRRN